MFRKFAARNFRCFQDFEIQPLARVNLIAGKNNVGKTALLEALNAHSAPSTPERIFTANLLRGVGNSSAAHWRELDWLFYAKQSDAVIELMSVHDRAGKGALQVRLAQPEERSLFPTEANGALKSELQIGAGVVSPNELVLDYEDSQGQVFTSSARLTPSETKSSSTTGDPFEIKFSSSNVNPYVPAILILNYPRFPEAYAEQYSALVETGRDADVLPALQALDPRIQRLDLLYRTNMPIFHADVGTVPLMPLLHMGEGIARVLSWLLVIMTNETGTVLIDEIENGLHYSALVDVWKAVDVAARESNVQVIATTHSWECVKAAQRAFADGDDDDFRLHRLEQRDGEIVAITYDQEQLETSIEFNFEVR